MYYGWINILTMKKIKVRELIDVLESIDGKDYFNLY